MVKGKHAKKKKGGLHSADKTEAIPAVGLDEQAGLESAESALDAALAEDGMADTAVTEALESTDIDASGDAPQADVTEAIEAEVDPAIAAANDAVTEALAADDTALAITEDTEVVPAAETMALEPVAEGDEDAAFPRNVEGKKKRNRKKIAIIVCSIVGGLLIAGYIAMSIYSMTHFAYKTTINNADVSFMTVEETEAVVADQVEGYELTLTTRTGDEVIRGADVDIAYVSDNKVQSLLDDQNPWLWFVPFFKAPGDQELHATVTYDHDKLKEVIDGLHCSDPTVMKPPHDAYPEYNGSEYVIHPEDLGSQINTEVVYDRVGEAIEATADTYDLSEGDCYVNPHLYQDNQDLINQVNTYNQYCRFSITYTFGDQTEQLDAQTAINWVVFYEDGTYGFDEEAVRAWLRDFGHRHDTIGTERSFTAADGDETTISGGSYGWEVDEDAEYDAIMEAINNNESQTREPIWVQTAATFDSPDWGNSYIDLDLTDQHVYVVIDGEIVFDAPVVTGLPIPSRETAPGVWYVMEMQRNKVLRGDIQADGRPEYETPVSYWIRMTGTGMGFHDASWQPWFGGDRYTYAGSHGCINMSYSDVQQMYDIVWVGMPIVSHY